MATREEFLHGVRQRLHTGRNEEAERAVRAVFQVLHRRLSAGQAGHIESHLPVELKREWDLHAFEDVARALGGQAGWDEGEFLERVQSVGRYPDKQEALEATQAVFGELKRVIPEKDARDTAAELPQGLRTVWQEA
ncbi:MAG TPA: DUF2267 domain-containing protein [Dehalococcoidia bacterium]